MCGRFGRLGEGTWLGQDWASPIENLEAQGYRFNSYNIAPKQIQPVITLSKPKEMQLFLWGLIPHDSPTSSPKYPYFNAKSENLHTLYPWKNIFPKQRCLVPAHFFYEWPKRGGKAIPGSPPFLFRLNPPESFSFAGIWDAWKNKETGGYEPSFTLLTTEPNTLVKNYHDRMPVLLKGDNESIWMNPESSLEEIAEVLKPFDPEKMMVYPVSPLVGNVQNNDPSLMNRIPWKN